MFRPAPLMPDVALVLFPPQKDDLSSASGADGFRAELGCLG